jgi:quercetin dioxygenase-like cupin family protein
VLPSTRVTRGLMVTVSTTWYYNKSRPEDNPFATEVLDPRVVHIAPGSRNEKHRHAHESLFLILEGRAVVYVGGCSYWLSPGQVLFVPRWETHQTINVSEEYPLRMLAITDFGLTSAALGDYDSQTRLKRNSTQGEDQQ